jgi:hypothetical protein
LQTVQFMGVSADFFAGSGTSGSAGAFAGSGGTIQ